MRYLISFLVAISFLVGCSKPVETTKKYNSIKEILEAMPRKPEKDDNKLAAEEAQSWLDDNAKDVELKITDSIDNVEENDGTITLEFKSSGLWKGYKFTLCIFGIVSPVGNPTKYSKLSKDDIVTIRGKIHTMEVKWDSKDASGTIYVCLVGDYTVIEKCKNPENNDSTDRYDVPQKKQKVNLFD